LRRAEKRDAIKLPYKTKIREAVNADLVFDQPEAQHNKSSAANKKG
jgi:hypothetical protein